MGYTGYTHEYLNPEKQGYAKYFMASVETMADANKALNLGWRYYRTVATKGETFQAFEIECPSEGYSVHCNTCLLCNGNQSGKNVFIRVHGSAHKIIRFNSEVKI
jgi:hypothetical protein